MDHVNELRKTLRLADGEAVEYYSLEALERALGVRIAALPYCLRVLLESLLRMQGHPAYTEAHVRAFAGRRAGPESQEEFPFLPGRVLLQDYTGVPCVADLAALRDAVRRAGSDPRRIEPQIPVHLVIDHSIQLDAAGCADALDVNQSREFERNRERYLFLRWGRSAFRKLKVLPPGLGICHQVNLEHLADCVTTEPDASGRRMAYPDTCVGTDSHTTTINSLGVLGWGVGGIEAEAAMLGQPIPILMPRVIGVRLLGALPPGATPTDLALAATEILRKKGVVECFVEFFGPGVEGLSLADRAPVANMAPEYGATTGFFPVDAATLRYLRETGRSEQQVDLVERYCKAQGLFRTPDAPAPEYTDVVEMDLSKIEPCAAGPKRPQDRVPLARVGASFRAALTAPVEQRGFGLTAEAAGQRAPGGVLGGAGHGAVLIASITSCTNTANPTLLVTAGLVAKKAAARGMKPPRHVRTSLAPGSRAVTAYLEKAGLLKPLEDLGFHVAAYGCATCIGNSGPLPEEIEQAVSASHLVAAAVLSGNRNFEGRIHPQTRANYLCSPPLVVAFALRGTVDADLANEPLGADRAGRPVFLKDLWPTPEEVRACAAQAADPALYRAVYGDLDRLNPAWNALPEGSGAVFAWDADSTYVQEPPFFAGFSAQPPVLEDLRDAAVLMRLGDFITTDHISPAGSIAKDSPAGKYLIERGVKPEDFNSYGARRGNHEVMMRGTFANARIRNLLVEREGGWTRHHPTGDVLSVYDAAMRYRAEGAPLLILAGKMYGAGSSRDWAAKGPALLGVRAVIAESFERIHRSNLVEMGVLPLEFAEGCNAASLGLSGLERYSITGIRDGLAPRQRLAVRAVAPDGARKTFDVVCRIDTPIEAEYYRHGGILNYVLRHVLAPNFAR